MKSIIEKKSDIWPIYHTLEKNDNIIVNPYMVMIQYGYENFFGNELIKCSVSDMFNGGKEIISEKMSSVGKISGAKGFSYEIKEIYEEEKKGKIFYGYSVNVESESIKFVLKMESLNSYVSKDVKEISTSVDFTKSGLFKFLNADEACNIVSFRNDGTNSDSGAMVLSFVCALIDFENFLRVYKVMNMKCRNISNVFSEMTDDIECDWKDIMFLSDIFILYVCYGNTVYTRRIGYEDYVESIENFVNKYKTIIK